MFAEHTIKGLLYPSWGEGEGAGGSGFAFLQEHIRRLAGDGKLEDVILDLSFGDRLIRLHEREVVKLRKDLADYEGMLGVLEPDFHDEIISKEQMQRYREHFSEVAEEISGDIDYQDGLRRRIPEAKEVCEERLARIRERGNIKELDRVLLVMLVDRILVYEGGRIELFLRFKR